MKTATSAPPDPKIAATGPSAPVKSTPPSNLEKTNTVIAASSAAGQTIFEPNSAHMEQQGLTSFIDSLPSEMEASSPITTQCDTNALSVDHTISSDIKSFMSRPTFVANVDWTSASGAGAVLATYDCPTDLLNLSAIKLEKVSRYQFISFDIVVRLFGSPIQFQAGRLIMSFETGRRERFARASDTNIITQSQLPHVIFDPAIPSPVEMRIPFCAPIAQWDTIGQYGLGSLFLGVLSPLTSASTSNSMTLSLQARFENVKLGVPTQTAPTTVPLRSALFSDSRHRIAYAEAREEVKEANHSHFISEGLDTVSTVATALGNFPLLAPIAQPVSWATSLAARAARAFGFSSPPDLTGPTRLMSHQQPNYTHFDSQSTAVPLTFSQGFDIPVAPVFGEDHDEMDINFVASKLAIALSFNWPDTAPVGSVLTYWPVMPGLCVKDAGAQNVSWGQYTPTPMAYIASMFKYWAGSIKYKLDCVSTPFHAGRLVLAYIPDFDPLGTFSVTEIGNNFNIVWDITDNSHIEFEVPYLGNTAYLNTILDNNVVEYLVNGETTGIEPRSRLRKCANGAIVIFVLNKLVAPSTASSSVNMLLWAGGGKDLCFSEPTLGNYRPAYPSAKRIDYTGKYFDGTVHYQPEMGVVPARSTEVDIAQDALDEVDWPSRPSSPRMAYAESMQDPYNKNSTQNLSDFSCWMPPNYINPVERAKLCTGEVITNLRQLTKRMSPSYYMFPHNVTTAGAMTSDYPSSNHVLEIDLDYFGTMEGSQDSVLYGRNIAPTGTTRGTTPNLSEMDTYLTYIGALYAYARGSRRFHLTTHPSNIINASAFTGKLLSDLCDPTVRNDQGYWDFRVSQELEMDTPPRQPYFRPDVSVIGYNYANDAFSTLPLRNYDFGISSLMLPDASVKKIGESGTHLEVSVPSSTNYPIRLLTTPATTVESDVIKAIDHNNPRTRRFLELRYRPFSSASFGTTSTFTPIPWPNPLVISEAAGDDFTFGRFQFAPKLVRIKQPLIFSNSTTGAKLRR